MLRSCRGSLLQWEWIRSGHLPDDFYIANNGEYRPVAAVAPNSRECSLCDAHIHVLPDDRDAHADDLPRFIILHRLLVCTANTLPGLGPEDPPATLIGHKLVPSLLTPLLQLPCLRSFPSIVPRSCAWLTLSLTAAKPLLC